MPRHWIFRCCLRILIWDLSYSVLFRKRGHSSFENVGIVLLKKWLLVLMKKWAALWPGRHRNMHWVTHKKTNTSSGYLKREGSYFSLIFFVGQANITDKKMVRILFYHIYLVCHTSYLIQFMLSWGNGGRFLSKGKVEIVFSRETKDESVEKESRTWGAGLCPESWIISRCFPERTFLEALRYNLGFRTQARRSCHRFLKNFDDFSHCGSSEIKFSPPW